MENKIIYYKQLDSTNTKLTELAREGADHGTVVVADAQTAGKGRRGRTWESPAGENIYMSVLLRPTFDASLAPMLTLCMAYSVAKVLEAKGFEDVKIKWPNDLVINGKKVCGILTEMQMNGSQIESVIVGVGINVNVQAFPEELISKATSLYLEGKRKINLEELIKEVVEEFFSVYGQFCEEKNLSFIQDKYNELLINKGKEVRVLEPENEYTAYAKGISRTGELLVVMEDGTEKEIYAGEVSVRGIFGYI